MTNAVRTGPLTRLTYDFELSRDVAYGTLVAAQDIPEALNQTSFTPVIDLAAGANYFWRVRVSDSDSGVACDYSAVRSLAEVLLQGFSLTVG